MSMATITNPMIKPPHVLQADLVAILAQQFRVRPEEIDVHEHLSNYGLDSLDAITVASELSESCGYDITFDRLWEYPSVVKIVEFVSQEMNRQ